MSRAKVKRYKIPRWFMTMLKQKVRQDGHVRRGQLTVNVFDHYSRAGNCHGFFDHCGKDADNNFITEPCAGNCQPCLDAAQELADDLGLKLTITLRAVDRSGQFRSATSHPDSATNAPV